ncbi:MAG: hypothetical protein QOD83_1247 [Solirubrobacteraceae bacterium]|jgi:hypothetical protein|nr:hypothetical protein [Solirubrobacteraceae bacterium]
MGGWAFIAAVAALQAGNMRLAEALGALFVIIVMGTAADRLPALHRLPFIGARKLQFAFTPELGGADHVALGRKDLGGYRGVALMTVGIKTPGRMTIDVVVTVIASPELRIERCTSDGVRREVGTWNPPVGELANPQTGKPASCWTSPTKLYAGDWTNLYIKLRPTAPGEYFLRVKTSGSERIYREQVQTTTIRAHDTMGDHVSVLIAEAEELRGELNGGAFVDNSRLMHLMLRAREAAPSLLFDSTDDVVQTSAPFEERRHQLDILRRYTAALYQAQRPAIVATR